MVLSEAGIVNLMTVTMGVLLLISTLPYVFIIRDIVRELRRS